MTAIISSVEVERWFDPWHDSQGWERIVKKYQALISKWLRANSGLLI